MKRITFTIVLLLLLLSAVPAMCQDDPFKAPEPAKPSLETLKARAEALSWEAQFHAARIQALQSEFAALQAQI